MKNIAYNLLLIIMAMLALTSCQETNYPGASISPFISIFDVKNLDKGQQVHITSESLAGSTQIAAVVVSDHQEGNIPAHLLIVQDKRRLNKLRGIAIDLGNSAAQYKPGDSLHIDIVGTELLREDGLLVLKGISDAKITKIASDKPIANHVVRINDILNDPKAYESTLVVLVKGGFNPMPKDGERLEGDKLLNDGFGNLTFRTDASSSFAQNIPYVMGNYYGIVFNSLDDSGELKPFLRSRKNKDMVMLSAELSPSVIVIAGFASDVKGSDTNYEYMQFLATEDIDFSKTPYAVVVSNNANASTPTGAPINGWATGGMRTYKFNLTSGFAKKGSFFYVGGKYQMINGSASTLINEANWLLNYDYSLNNGFDFGTKTSGLLANSGNAFGIAVFKGTNVTKASEPIDVMMNSGGGALWDTDRGYRIRNNDFYDIINPLTLIPQPYFKQGTNQLFLKYNTSDFGYFVSLGGEYNIALGRWTTARAQHNVEMTKSSLLSDIEHQHATKIVE